MQKGLRNLNMQNGLQLEHAKVRLSHSEVLIIINHISLSDPQDRSKLQQRYYTMFKGNHIVFVLRHQYFYRYFISAEINTR